MDAEAQMNGNGSANEDTQNGTNGIEEHVLEETQHTEIETLKEKARQSVGDEIQLHKTYGDMDEGIAAEAPAVDDMETAQKSFDEGDEDNIKKEGISNEEVDEVPDHKEFDDGPENRESGNVNEHRDYDEIPEQKVSDEITEQEKSDEFPENEKEDIAEQRDSDEPTENEESPGKMMAVSCDSIDVMSTTAEDGSEVGAEEVQSPVSNEGKETSEGTSENTLNGEQSPEVEQVIEEVDHLMEEARDADSSLEEEKDITVEETTEVESEDTTHTEPLEVQSPEPSSDVEVMSPEPTEVVEEQMLEEAASVEEADEAQSAPAEEQEVPAEETHEEIQEDSQPEIEVGERHADKAPEEDQTDEEDQEDNKEPVVDLDAVKQTGTMDEEQCDLAAGSSHDEEADGSAEVQDVKEEGTSQEEPVEFEEEQQTIETDHSMDEVAREEQASVKEEEDGEEKEQESLQEDAVEVAEVESDGQEDVPPVEELEIAEEDAAARLEAAEADDIMQEEKPEVESEVVEETHQEDSAPEEESRVPETSQDIDNIEPNETTPESLQNYEEINNVEQECAESDIVIESDVPADVENQENEKLCEIERSEVEADNVNELQNNLATSAAGMATSEDSAQESKTEEDLSKSHVEGHSPTRKISAQERFGLPASLSSSESLHAVLQEEDGSVSSDGASSGGSPKHKRKSRRTSDIEGDMEQVENTVRKMSVGSSKEWYKDLFKMTRSEVDKNVVDVGEDNREEEIQSLPSLRNIKSRFENRDGEAPQKEVKQPGKIKVEWGASDMRQKEVSPSPPRDPDIFREQKVQTQEEVLVSYGGLTSIKSRYLESSSPVAPTQGPPPPKVIPRSEEPVQKAPSVSPPREAGVIRSDEPKDETEELPPQNITKGLLARFRDMESQSGNQASAPAPYNKRNVHAKPAPAPAATRPAATGDWERIERSAQGEKSNSSAKLRKPSRSDVMNDAHSPTGMKSPVGDENRNGDEVKEEFPSSPIHVLASRYGTSIRASPKSSSQPAQKKTSGGSKVWTPPPKAEKLASPPKIPKHLKRSPIKTTPAPRTDLIEADLTRPDQPAEAGEFESQPQFRDDVIREDDDNETEFLPASGNLKSRLAVFKQMEATNANQPSSTPSFGNQYSTRQSPSRMNGNPGNSHPGEVLREGEANPEEELPQVGAAKNMREKFQSLQQTDGAPANSGDKKATAKSKQLLNSTEPKEHRFTPPRGSPEKQRPEVTSAGPPRQDNITRSEDPLQQEPLPTQEILHTCLNHFRQMEEEAKIQKSREYSPGPKNTSVTNSFATEFHAGQKSAPPKPARTVLTSGVDSTVYNPAAPEGGEYENEPILRDDVIRESDHFEVQELPQEGQARKLREQYLAKVH